MITVYVDTLILENLMIDSCLLVFVAKICDLPIYKLNIFMSGLIGGIYAMAHFLPYSDITCSIPFKVLVSFIMVCISFKTVKKCIKCCAIFWALGFMLCGVVYGISLILNLGQVIYGTSVYIDINVKIVILGGTFVGLLVYIWLKRTSNCSTYNTEAIISIRHNGREIEFTGFVDSGNKLKDPISNKRVLVCEKDIFEKIYPILKKFKGKSIIDSVQLLEGGKIYFRLIPFKTLGSQHNLLPAFKVDEIWINGKKSEINLVAVSENKVFENGKYHALVGID